MRILVVCTGNTCRSPMAEALIRKKIPNVEVQSAGIYAGEGFPASNQAQKVLKEAAIDFPHRSKLVTPERVAWADLILTMTESHKQTLLLHYPETEDKLFTLPEYASPVFEENWQQLMTLYAEIETKRAAFSQTYQGNPAEFDREFASQMKQELNKIQQLEASLPKADVNDPFGQDVAVYKETFQELDSYIEQLKQKLARSDSEDN